MVTKSCQHKFYEHINLRNNKGIGILTNDHVLCDKFKSIMSGMIKI
jgi:hypothetical protein